MTNTFMRGSAPSRAQPAYLRPGSFKQGHEKRGGRKRGTPNLFSSDYKKVILEAAYRIGEDGNGKNGVAGYLSWVAEYHPQIFCTLLMNLVTPGNADSDAPEEPHRTIEESTQRVRDYIGLTRKDLTKGQTVQVESEVTMGLDRPTVSCWQSHANGRRESEALLHAARRGVSATTDQATPEADVMDHHRSKGS